MLFLPPSVISKIPLGPSSHRDAGQVLPHRVWSLHVSPGGRTPCVLSISMSLHSDLHDFVPAGSLSRRLTTSCVSSEDVNPTVGQYGSVVEGAFAGTVV